MVSEIIVEQKVFISPEYKKKEKLREELQNIIVQRVASGFIQSEEDLKSTLTDINTAMTALKMIPLDAWKRLAEKK